MCETKSAGIMPGFLIGRGQKAAQPCQCHLQPRKTRTESARDVLAWIGGICAASAVGSGALGRVLGVGLHVAVIMVGVVVGLAVAGCGWLLWRRVRSLSQPQIAPWLPPAPPRTEVTSVRVQEIGQRRARPGLVHPGGPPHSQGLTRPRGVSRDSRAP